MKELSGEPPHVVAQRVQELRNSMRANPREKWFFLLTLNTVLLTACKLITEFTVQNVPVRYGAVRYVPVDVPVRYGAVRYVPGDVYLGTVRYRIEGTVGTVW